MFDVHSLLVVKLHLGIDHTLISEQKFCSSFTLNVNILSFATSLMIREYLRKGQNNFSLHCLKSRVF